MDSLCQVTTMAFSKAAKYTVQFNFFGTNNNSELLM